MGISCNRHLFWGFQVAIGNTCDRECDHNCDCECDKRAAAAGYDFPGVEEINIGGLIVIGILIDYSSGNVGSEDTWCSSGNAELPSEQQMKMLNDLRQEGDGKVRLFWGMDHS